MNKSSIIKRIEAIEKGAGGERQFLLRYKHADGRYTFWGPPHGPDGTDPRKYAPDRYEFITLVGVCTAITRPDLVPDGKVQCDKCDDREKCGVRITETRGSHYVA